MLPDDVFRDRLEQTLAEIEKSIASMRECATIEVKASTRYWSMAALPFQTGACPFELMVKSDQKFSLKLADEAFENRPVERFELFPQLVRAIEAGRVERISKFDAMTDALVGIEMRVELEPGWDWLAERRLASVTTAEEWQAHRYLPYRR
jgi:hypothetical protein